MRSLCSSRHALERHNQRGWASAGRATCCVLKLSDWPRCGDQYLCLTLAPLHSSKRRLLQTVSQKFGTLRRPGGLPVACVLLKYMKRRTGMIGVHTWWVDVRNLHWQLESVERARPSWDFGSPNKAPERNAALSINVIGGTCTATTWPPRPGRCRHCSPPPYPPSPVSAMPNPALFPDGAKYQALCISGLHGGA